MWAFLFPSPGGVAAGRGGPYTFPVLKADGDVIHYYSVASDSDVSGSATGNGFLKN
jgi:hypothetical protein